LNCELCFEKAIQKHHISYFPEKTVAVCNKCHRKIHIHKDRNFIKFKKGDSDFFYSMKKRLWKWGVML